MQKKLINIFFLLIMSLTVLSGVNYTKDQPILEPRPIPDIQIDGELKESISTEPLKLKKGNNSATIYIGYDSNGLYFYADVDCPTPKMNNKKEGDLNKVDCIEIFLSSDPNADFKRTKYGVKDFHLGIKASKENETWNWQYKAPLVNPELYYKEKDHGYIMECKIPWSNFDIGCLCKVNGRVLSFDIALDIGTTGLFGNRTQIRWCGDKSIDNNPSQWGKAVF